MGDKPKTSVNFKDLRDVPLPLAEPTQLDLERMSPEQLRVELKNARELLMLIGSIYYTTLLMNDGDIKPVLSIPTDFAASAHELMEGRTLERDVAVQLIEASKDSYNSIFEDKQKTLWIFSVDRVTGVATIHTTKVCEPDKLPKEVRLWLAAVKMVHPFEPNKPTIKLVTNKEIEDGTIS